MSRTVLFKTLVLPGNRIEICAPELPEGSIATVHVTVEEADALVSGEASSDLEAAEQHFLRELPQLLQTAPGQWVAYARGGLLARGDEELPLFRLCEARGLMAGHFLVARVEPELPAAEVTENWLQKTN